MQARRCACCSVCSSWWQGQKATHQRGEDVALTLEQTREDSRECHEGQVAAAKAGKQWCGKSDKAPGGGRQQDDLLASDAGGDMGRDRMGWLFERVTINHCTESCGRHCSDLAYRRAQNLVQYTGLSLTCLLPQNCHTRPTSSPQRLSLSPNIC